MWAGSARPLIWAAGGGIFLLGRGMGWKEACHKEMKVFVHFTTSLGISLNSAYPKQRHLFCCCAHSRQSVADWAKLFCLETKVGRISATAIIHRMHFCKRGPVQLFAPSLADLSDAIYFIAVATAELLVSRETCWKYRALEAAEQL